MTYIEKFLLICGGDVLIGLAAVALLLFVYLGYVLIKPEKF